MLSSFTGSLYFGRGSRSTIYVPEIVADNLYFQVDASNSNSYPGSGITWYNLLNGIDFTINGATWSSTDGGRFDFDGVNDFTYPNLTNTTLQLKTTPQTLQVWVKFNSFGSDNPIFNFFSSTNIPYTPSDGYMLYVQSDRTIVSYTDGSSGVRLVNSTSTVSANQWYLITYVFQASSAANTTRVYVNTTEYISTSHGSDTVSTNQGQGLRIAYNGQPGGLGKYSNCSIGAVYAYTDALTAEEVAFNYDATKTRYETVLTANLVAHLDASNTSSYSGSGSTWTDLTGNGNHGTINGATWSSTDGGIFDFDGTNDTIQIAHNASLSLSTSTQKTIQVWVKFDALGATSTQQIPVFGKLSSSYAFDGYWGGLYGNTGTIRVVTNGAAVQRITTSTLTVTTNTWYLFTFVSQITSTSNTTKVYINGTEYATTAHGSDTYTESNPLYLGYIGSGVGSLYLNGKIGACYFYTRGLSSTEVLQNFNATKSRYGVS